MSHISPYEWKLTIIKQVDIKNACLKVKKTGDGRYIYCLLLPAIIYTLPYSSLMKKAVLYLH